MKSNYDDLFRGCSHQQLATEDLQQPGEHVSIPQVVVEVRYATGHSGEVGVNPLGEGLLLHRISFVCPNTQESATGGWKKYEVRQTLLLMSSADTKFEKRVPWTSDLPRPWCGSTQTAWSWWPPSPRTPSQSVGCCCSVGAGLRRCPDPGRH